MFNLLQPGLNCLGFLQTKGIDGRLVGGCVRNYLTGHLIQNWDIAVRSTPEILQSIDWSPVHLIPLAPHYGIFGLPYQGFFFEISCLRRDLQCDGRQASVDFQSEFSEDALRRDLTINALYMDQAGFIEDWVGGKEDLRKGVIRFIGDPNQRIQEDYLRILRFFRMMAHFSNRTQAVDSRTMAALVAHRFHLTELSGERVHSELVKLLSASQSDQLLSVIQLMRSLEIDQVILGIPFQITQFKHFLDHFSFLQQAWLRLAVLWLSSSTLNRLQTRLCLSRKSFHFLKRLVQYENETNSRWVAFKEGVNFSLYLQGFQSARRKVLFDPIATLPYWIPPFPLAANDLIQLGIPVGPQIGMTLERIQRQWAESSYQMLLDECRENAKNLPKLTNSEEKYAKNLLCREFQG
jgi:poly(A) polymerase